ncbi:MAG: 6-pyruvoyl-tetrahydropterin synthase-related protein [Christensenellales bacterium]|nr:6-pyruvoyl-tetrahydropterin synthase-related protein [Christensenellales bacterium]
MAKKGLQVLALWLVLAALVFLYTDRDEYTWAFEGETLAQVLLDTRQAQGMEDAARQALEQERERARERGGLWDQAEQYGGAPHTRPAVDEALGLNLMWGTYEAAVDYASPEALSLRAVSALRGAFIEDGETTLPAGEGTAQFAFTLTDACSQLAFACDLPKGAQIRRIVVHKAGAGVFSRDLAAYAALLGAVLTVLLMLSWDDRPVGRLRRRDALTVVGVALFASMPLLFSGIYDGHDLFFHLNRIEGVAAALRAGQFPARIHASTLLGYGYAAPQFYPELFLYLPAVLRNAGVSLAASVRVLGLSINLAAAGVCYASARAVMGSRRVALGATALYMLCSYRLSNLYVRATLGESLAMIFFPLLIWAMVEVLTRDERRWPLLALAMTGIFMSHLLSTLFAVGLCALCALCCARRLLREPRRILACVKAALVMLLCSAWFLVPFLDFGRAGINTSVAVMASDHMLEPGAFLVGFPSEKLNLPYEATHFSYTVGVVPGLALMLGCALLLARLYMNRGARSREDALGGAMLALSALLLLGATAFLPWAWACRLSRPYSSFVQQIQYPWRLVGMAVPLMAFAAAWGYLRQETRRTPSLVAVLALCMVLSGYAMQQVVQDVPLLTKEDFCDTRIEQYEYTYEGTEKGLLVPGEIVAHDAGDYAVRNVKKQGTNLTLTLDVPQGLSSLDVPLLYYPGYRAEANGEPCRVARGENNVVRVYGVPQGEGVEVSVRYAQSAAWRAADAVSVLGAALLGVLLARMKRRRA